MLYDSPALLAYSLSDKIRPAMRNLDKNKNITPDQATIIVVGEATILASSIPRTNLLIQMIIDNNIMPLFLRKPKCFRTSPELLYALIKFAEEKGRSMEDVLLSEAQFVNRYGLKTEELKEKYDPKDEYGEEEYFDK